MALLQRIVDEMVAALLPLCGAFSASPTASGPMRRLLLTDGNRRRKTTMTMESGYGTQGRTSNIR